MPELQQVHNQPTGSSILASNSPTGTAEIKNLNRRLQHSLRELRDISIIDELPLSIPREVQGNRRRNSEVLTDIQYEVQSQDSPVGTRKRAAFPRMSKADLF